MMMQRSWNKYAVRLLAVSVLGTLLTLAGCASAPPAADARPRGEPAESAAPRTTPARLTVVQTARDMIGRPYRYGGAGPRGFDCSGLVYFSFAHAGIDVPRSAHQQYRHATPVGSRKLLPGDLVFFDIGGRRISHVGIYLGEGAFVHAPSRGKRVSVDSLDDPYWRKRIVGSGHFF